MKNTPKSNYTSQTFKENKVKVQEMHEPELEPRKDSNNILEVYREKCDLDDDFFIKMWYNIDPLDRTESDKKWNMH